MRTCVACRTEREKRDLVRVVRSPTGDVFLDPTGKAAGRGAYLCADGACWSHALKRRAVQRALQVPSSEALSALLQAGPPSSLAGGHASGTSAHGAGHGA